MEQPEAPRESALVRPEVETRVLSEAEFPEWEALVARSAEGSVYSEPEYLDALCEAAGGSFKILASRRGDELLGHRANERKRRRGHVRAPTPWLYYNGTCCDPTRPANLAAHGAPERDPGGARGRLSGCGRADRPALPECPDDDARASREGGSPGRITGTWCR